MSKLDNYIYYEICEFSMKIYKKYTYFLSYRGFCEYYKKSLSNGEVQAHMKVLLNIVIRLNKIYGLNEAQATDYICQFFELEKYKKYERVIILMNETHKNSIMD